MRVLAFPLRTHIRKTNRCPDQLDACPQTGKHFSTSKASVDGARLAWLLARKPWIVQIPGTTKLHRLKENIGAAEIELTPDDLREIDSVAPKIEVEGARYPEKLEQMTGL